MTLLFEPSRTLPLVRFAIIFPSGRAQEPPGKEGVARLTARMLRRGSQRRSSTEIEHQLDRLGAELQVRVGFGLTTVRCETLSRSLDAAVGLVAELITEPAFDEAELARLTRQAEAELISARDDDSSLCSRALRRHVFAGHPHGLRVAGSRAGIAATHRDDVVAFHHRTFQRAGCGVAVTGDIDEDGASRLAEKLLGGLP